jgi:hypothetical protein
MPRPIVAPADGIMPGSTAAACRGGGPAMHVVPVNADMGTFVVVEGPQASHREFARPEPTPTGRNVRRIADAPPEWRTPMPALQGEKRDLALRLSRDDGLVDADIASRIGVSRQAVSAVTHPAGNGTSQASAQRRQAAENARMLADYNAGVEFAELVHRYGATERRVACVLRRARTVGTLTRDLVLSQEEPAGRNGTPSRPAPTSEPATPEGPQSTTEATDEPTEAQEGALTQASVAPEEGGAPCSSETCASGDPYVELPDGSMLRESIADLCREARAEDESVLRRKVDAVAVAARLFRMSPAMIAGCAHRMVVGHHEHAGEPIEDKDLLAEATEEAEDIANYLAMLPMQGEPPSWRVIKAGLLVAKAHRLLEAEVGGR